MLQVYFDGLYEGDTKKLGEAFHPRLASLQPPAATARPPTGRAPTGSRWWKSRPSAKAKGSARADRIVSIDFSGPATAFAKVECQLPPRYFTDYLTLLKVDGRWQVISKAFHTVTKEVTCHPRHTGRIQEGQAQPGVRSDRDLITARSSWGFLLYPPCERRSMSLSPSRRPRPGP